MAPFVVNPVGYNKVLALDAAQGYVGDFLSHNGLPGPSKLITEATTRHENRWRDNGWYKFDTREMFVNLKRSRVPVKVPGFQWSFTGFKADLTAPGILAHETGHHVHNLLNPRFGAQNVIAMIRKCAANEPRVSSYEPNAHETFAEAMRLFILNPELLREGRPIRWAMLTGDLNLKPLHAAPWRDVLVHAHPRLIAAAEKWIRHAL